MSEQTWVLKIGWTHIGYELKWDADTDTVQGNPNWNNLEEDVSLRGEAVKAINESLRRQHLAELKQLTKASVDAEQKCKSGADLVYLQQSLTSTDRFKLRRCG